MFTASEVQPKLGFPSPTWSVHSFDSEKPFAALQETHQQLCQCTDSAGILMYSVSWLIFSWLIFSWVIGSVSLHDLLDDPGRLLFDSVNDVFVHGVRQFSKDPRFLEPAPLPCKFPSVNLHLFPERRHRGPRRELQGTPGQRAKSRLAKSSPFGGGNAR